MLTDRVPRVRNPLMTSLLGLRGNGRACVYTEPMWGLSMMLVLPYASVFMLALGLRDQQIGLLASISMLSQVVFGLLGGVITDKLGRRLTTAVFDVVAWSIPCLIWAVRANFWYFLVASVINGAWQVTQNSWDCLLVEDVDRGEITKVYSLIKVAAEFSALFAPIAALLVSQFGLVPAVRMLYLNAFVIMTAKIVILYRWSTETAIGRLRREQTRGVSMWRLLAEYRGVLRPDHPVEGDDLLPGARGDRQRCHAHQRHLLAGGHQPATGGARPAAADLPDGALAAVGAVLLHRHSLADPCQAPEATDRWAASWRTWPASCCWSSSRRRPGSADWSTYALLGVCLVLDAFGAGILFMLTESLVALHVDRDERSRVMAIQRTCVMLVTAPFGWISGWLSGIDRTWPFLLTSALLVLGIGGEPAVLGDHPRGHRLTILGNPSSGGLGRRPQAGCPPVVSTVPSAVTRRPTWWGRVASHVSAPRPRTNAAVAYTSAQVSSGPMTVADSNSVAHGSPVAGSVMWWPRAAVPDVATAPVRSFRVRRRRAAGRGGPRWRSSSPGCRCAGSARRCRRRR